MQLIVDEKASGPWGESPLDATLDAARQALETNYLGLISMTQAFAPVLAGNGGGAFDVNVLWVVSWVANPLLTTYAASKSAEWSYTNAARIQLGSQGTQVVGVHVGLVDTRLTAFIDRDKIPPADVATSALDALEAGEREAIVDERSRIVKAGLSDDQHALYPTIEQEFLAIAR